MEHIVKCQAEYFDAVERGDKLFEVRCDDRVPIYTVGDTLRMLRCEDGQATGKTLSRKITYVYRGQYCRGGYCILSLEPERAALPPGEFTCAGCRHERSRTLEPCHSCRRNPRRLAQYEDSYAPKTG